MSEALKRAVKAYGPESATCRLIAANIEAARELETEDKRAGIVEPTPLSAKDRRRAKVAAENRRGTK
jgi:hypothetical protein